MDISSDYIRREAKESQVEHRQAMRSMRDLVARLFSGTSPESPRAKEDFALSGLNRRRFLQIGGLSVATAAVFAACGNDGTTAEREEAEEENMPGAQSKGAGAQKDIQILRTASSLEALAVAAYQMAIDSGLVKTAAIGDAAKLFKDQHAEHGKLFEGTTKKLGGEPFTEPNPVVLQMLDPQLKALKTEQDVVRLARDLEMAAAATYQSSVGQFTDKTLNAAAMSVGGVEARHVAVLSSVLMEPTAPKAFQTTDGAVAAGTGV